MGKLLHADFRCARMFINTKTKRVNIKENTEQARVKKDAYFLKNIYFLGKME